MTFGSPAINGRKRIIFFKKAPSWEPVRFSLAFDRRIAAKHYDPWVKFLETALNRDSGSMGFKMRSKRTLRKIEAMCSTETDVYECDACMWMVNVASTKALSEVEMDFKAHNCDNNSLSKTLAATDGNNRDTVPVR